MPVPATTLGLKLDNLVVPFALPAGRYGLDRCDAPEPISADLPAYIVFSDDTENNYNCRYHLSPKVLGSCDLQLLS